MLSKAGTSIQCHYDILGVVQDADATAVKKAHRKLALKFHPDKNNGDVAAAEEFLLVQQAYEVLSDPQERKWYDDHRDALLAGWSAGRNSEDSGGDMLFEVVQYMHPGCYSGYHNGEGGFFDVFTKVFEEIFQFERKQTHVIVELPTYFGDNETEWANVQRFYHTWESFVSQLNFSWKDKYNINEDAPNRRVRRLMEDENKKLRRIAKKTYNQDILALVAFVKRRDPRVIAKQAESKLQKVEQSKKQNEEAAERKRENERAKQAWRQQAQREMESVEEEDRLAGRVRLADLEDDYDYGRKKRGKKKKNRCRMDRQDDEKCAQNEAQENDKHPNGIDDAPGGEGAPAESSEVLVPGTQANASPGHSLRQEMGGSSHSEIDKIDYILHGVGDDDSHADNYSSTDEESQPDFWHCECCRKNFKSVGQMTNHMKSKKHMENQKTFQAKIGREEDETMSKVMAELDVQETR